MNIETVPKQAKSRKKKTKEKQKIAKTQAIIAGLVLAVIGSLIASSFEKGTLTNYAGFGMILAGIASFVVGGCSMASANVENRIRRDLPNLCSKGMGPPLCRSIWLTGLGVILVVIGSILANTFAKDTVINTAGFGMLLMGIAVFIVGIAGAALGTVRIELNQNKKVDTDLGIPKIVFFDIVSIGMGVISIVIGSILAGSFEKESLMNYMGFSILIFGVAILSLGASGTVVAILKFRLTLNEFTKEIRPGIILGSIWAIGIGAMLFINGSLISSSYAKNTLMNNAGFVMLLAGTGVFVYGMFETARISATGYLSNRQNIIKLLRRQSTSRRKQESRRSRLRVTLRNLVATSAILNLAGIITAVCVLFFSLWQLDLIVSGPVWWSSSEYGQGIGWSHPNGAYANDYFQCFIWKTTIGEAYDTLFMLVFLSFIVMFASAYFWPKGNKFGGNLLHNLRGEESSKKRRVKRKKRKFPAEIKVQPVEAKRLDDSPEEPKSDTQTEP